jgi:hypothetical protein
VPESLPLLILPMKTPLKSLKSAKNEPLHYRTTFSKFTHLSRRII